MHRLEIDLSGPQGRDASGSQCGTALGESSRIQLDMVHDADQVRAVALYVNAAQERRRSAE